MDSLPVDWSMVSSCSPAPAKNSRPVYTSFNSEAQGFQLEQRDKSIFHQPGTPWLALIAFWINSRRAQCPKLCSWPLIVWCRPSLCEMRLQDADSSKKKVTRTLIWSSYILKWKHVVCLKFTFVIFDVLTLFKRQFAAVFLETLSHRSIKYIDRQRQQTARNGVSCRLILFMLSEVEKLKKK